MGLNGCNGGNGGKRKGRVDGETEKDRRHGLGIDGKGVKTGLEGQDGTRQLERTGEGLDGLE